MFCVEFESKRIARVGCAGLYRGYGSFVFVVWVLGVGLRWNAVFCMFFENFKNGFCWNFYSFKMEIK